MDKEPGSGWLFFSSLVLITAGIMRVLDGFWAIRTDAQVPELDDQLFGDELSTYGWIWLLVGVVLIAAGMAIYQKSQLARWIGIFAGAFMAITATMWLPFREGWALVYILIGFFVMYGLAVYGGRDEVAP